MQNNTFSWVTPFMDKRLIFKLEAISESTSIGCKQTAPKLIDVLLLQPSGAVRLSSESSNLIKLEAGRHP